jgi:hypothetical protein
LAISEEQFAELEAEMEIINRISGSFDQNSAPAVTLRRASIALFFAITHHGDTFEDFVTNFDQAPTQEQQNRLKALGLETDS